jgi:hypothetical protein
MKIGIIQTRGLGDIIIAAPIAEYYISRGCDVFWPIDSDFLDAFQYAFPKIKFIPISQSSTGILTADYFYNEPYRELKDLNCNAILCLYSFLTGFDFGYGNLKDAISFDAYKYAVAKVPFSEKWKIKIKRNPIREVQLFHTLGLSPNEKYSVIHDQGSVYSADLDHFIPKENRKIKIETITDNFLDWLGVLENADSFYVINSVYSNLIEQLNFAGKKNFFSQTTASWTPVLINDWHYISSNKS